MQRRKGPQKTDSDLPSTEKEEAEFKDDENSATSIGPKRVRPPPVFEYPALPVWETVFNFAAMISVLLYAWYLVYQASRKYEWRGGWGSRRNQEWPVLGAVLRDTTNYEWDQYQPILYKFVPALCGHSLLFNILHALVGSRKYIAEGLDVLYSICVCIWMFEPRVVGVSICHGILIFAFAKLATHLKAALSPKILDWTPLRLIVWIPAATFLYINLEYPDVFSGGADFFPSLLFVSYKLLQYIGFGSEMYSGKNYPPHSSLANEIWSMFRFTFYLPYLVSVIVLYPDFRQQIDQRNMRSRNWKATLFYTLRIFFWYWIIELVILNFFYFDAMLADYRHLRLIDQPTLVSLGYATGQFFQMKYVVIFGIPAVFAKFDNMEPPQGPICISRVALYSKMWRCFDRGLYNFFKEYIFLPICEPSFSIFRKIVGLCVSYLFVVLWHGFSHQYLVWIGINVAELFMEQISKALYSIKAVKEFRERNLSDTKFRRILAWLQICPFAFALYSTFYFLAGDQAGFVFVDRIFWGETYTLQYPFFILITIGYFYCNCCMDCERWFGTRAAKLKTS